MTDSSARRDHRLQLRRLGCDKEETMSDFQAIADRVEIEALRGEFTDAAMMRDGHRLASLFTHDGVLRMPNIPAEFKGREEIRVGRRRLVALWDFFVQTTHPGTIQLDGDTASGRMRPQTNLIRAAADPRSRRSLGEQI
jgi:ketosteroid isomerase-like protein